MGKRRRTKKKGRTKWVLPLLILIGIGASFVYYYRHDLSVFLRPRPEKKEPPGPQREVTLFFSDPEEEYLVGEKKEIRWKEKIKSDAETLLLELIKGPRKMNGPLFPTLPAQTRLLSVQVDEKSIARVNFNRAFIENHPGGTSAEIMTVYSVVNTLTLNLPGIKGVQFLVDGKEIESVTGHLSLRGPVSSKPDLIRGYRKK